ncbi:MAG TPA: hypothetical protein VMV94_09365 [Phycisphaerae bacterium]|nr:hypothetical protein [Phycisphaerae bacterium]
MFRLFVLIGSFAGVAAGVVSTAMAEEPASAPTTQPDEGEALPVEPLSTPRRPAPLDLQQLNLELGFESSYDERTVHDKSFNPFNPFNPFGGHQRQLDRASHFGETLGLQASGNAGGEDFFLFDIDATYGLSQDWFSETGVWPRQSERPHGDLLEYDMNFTLLPRGKLTADGYAQKLDSRVPRMFLPSLDRSLERYGGDVVVNDATFPMRLSYEHLDEKLTGRGWQYQDNEKRASDTFRYEGTWQPSKNQALRLEYEYSDRHEQYSGNTTRFDTIRNYLTIDHTLRFGKDDKSSWETLARFQDEDGKLGRDYTEFSTRLHLQHTDALATNYAFQYLRDSFQRLQTDTTRGEGGLSYKFSEALTGMAQFYALEQQAHENADFTEWGGVGSLSYGKDNSLGRFSANVSYNHTDVQTQQGQREGIVIAEAVTMTDPLPSILAHVDVNIWTVLVTDSTRARTFLPGRDYLVVPMGRYAGLLRVPTGAIADRQTVLVSYTYKVADNNGVRRDRLDFRVQQDFKNGFTPYYAGSLQDEDIEGQRFFPYEERNVNRHRVGATYRQKLWSVGLEYEYNDDSIDPYQAVHGNGDIVLWQSAAQQLDGKMTVSRFGFSGADCLPSHDTTLVDVGTTYRYLLRRDLEANASAMYRHESDTEYGNVDGVDLTAALDWRIGYFTLRFETEYDLLSLPQSRDDGFSFWLKLRREIPVINKETR